MPINGHQKKALGGNHLHYQTTHNIVNLGNSRSRTPKERNGMVTSRKDEASNHRLQKYINTASHTGVNIRNHTNHNESNISYNNTMSTT